MKLGLNVVQFKKKLEDLKIDRQYDMELQFKIMTHVVNRLKAQLSKV